jgi:acetyl-CoA carboxylase carboxyltransferase component
MALDGKYSETCVGIQAEAKLGGGDKARGQQHEKGKLNRSRTPASCLMKAAFKSWTHWFTHHVTDFGLDQRAYLGRWRGDGYGTIEGRLVYVFAQDFTVMGGSLGQAHAARSSKCKSWP